MPPMVAREDGRDIDRKPQPVRLELPVEIVEHDAGLDRAAGALDVEVEDPREIFRAIDDQRFADGLPGLRRSAAARQHRRALAARNRYRPIGFFNGARRHHADRHDLVVRRIGGVAAARESGRIEPRQSIRLLAAVPDRASLPPIFLSFLGCARPMHKVWFAFAENRLTAMLHS